MSTTYVPPAGVARLRALAGKLRWGVRVVGVGSTLRGAARVAALRLARPARSEIRLRGGPVLEFDYPSQFPPGLMLFGDLIDPEFAFLREIAAPGWMVVDVGAAIGQFAMFATTLPGARVHAFEPSLANVRTLTRNARRNGVAGRVAIHQLALSNSEGEARFATADRTFTSGLARGDAADGELVRVRTLTGVMDTLGIGHVDVLKVNVAGFEPAVLEGARTFLAAGRADVLIVLLGLDSLPWYATIAALGYRFFYYHPRQRTLFEVTAFDAPAVLDHRPWPARHIIGLRAAALPGLAAGLPIRPLPAGP